MTTEEFSNWFGQIKGVVIKKIEEDRIFFECLEEMLVVKITRIAEKTDNFLSLHTRKKEMVLCLHKHKLDDFKNKWEEPSVKKGIPDLSVVTCRQMAAELKKRSNLTFALIWLEEEATENFNLEAIGNPTTLCGILSRGLNMAIKWADRDVQYGDNNKEDNI